MNDLRQKPKRKKGKKEKSQKGAKELAKQQKTDGMKAIFQTRAGCYLEFA